MAISGDPPWNTLRHEVLFSVCFADSYLFEWVRDEALAGDHERLRREYFPITDRRGTYDRWRETPRQLFAEGLMPRLPGFAGPHGENWRRLLTWRDGLSHANASRPRRLSGVAPEYAAVPEFQDLYDAGPGWAVSVVCEQVQRFHDAAGTDLPVYITGSDELKLIYSLRPPRSC